MGAHRGDVTRACAAEPAGGTAATMTVSREDGDEEERELYAWSTMSRCGCSPSSHGANRRVASTGPRGRSDRPRPGPADADLTLVGTSSYACRIAARQRRSPRSCAIDSATACATCSAGSPSPAATSRGGRRTSQSAPDQTAFWRCAREMTRSRPSPGRRRRRGGRSRRRRGGAGPRGESRLGRRHRERAGGRRARERRPSSSTAAVTTAMGRTSSSLPGRCSGSLGHRDALGGGRLAKLGAVHRRPPAPMSLWPWPRQLARWTFVRRLGGAAGSSRSRGRASDVARPLGERQSCSRFILPARQPRDQARSSRWAPREPLGNISDRGRTWRHGGSGRSTSPSSRRACGAMVGAYRWPRTPRSPSR